MKKPVEARKKPSMFVRLMIVVLALIVGICIGLIVIMAGSSEPGSATASTNEAYVILENDIAKVSYEKAFEATGISGAFYLQLKMENKSDREVWVYLDSVSVDDAMVTPMSGVPTIIAPGKYSTNPFILSGNLEDAEEVTFRIVYADNETSAQLFQSDYITVSVK